MYSRMSQLYPWTLKKLDRPSWPRIQKLLRTSLVKGSSPRLFVWLSIFFRTLRRAWYAWKRRGTLVLSDNVAGICYGYGPKRFSLREWFLSYDFVWFVYICACSYIFGQQIQVGKSRGFWRGPFALSGNFHLGHRGAQLWRNAKDSKVPKVKWSWQAAPAPR